MERVSQPKVYRQGDPLTCQRIWDVIKQIRLDRKSPTAENILRYYCKSFDISADVMDQQLKFLCHDSLILQKVTAPVKGCNKGVEQIVFCIPNESEIDLSGKNDWYCFHCHKPGEVLACISCPRVFHLTCLTDFKVVELDTGFICPACKEIALQPVCDDFDRAELNHLLSFACARLEEKLPINSYSWNPLNNPAHVTPFTTDRCAALQKKLPKQVNTDEESWRSKFLLKLPVNLSKINDRTDRQVYKSLAQFQLDSATVVHNVTLFHGEHSSLADSARVMQRDCLYELEEIKLCTDCYKRSNKQEEKNWFCLPCDPPHELVFAKAKGYPFWPAKVLKVSNDNYDVRFFGAGHDRAVLDKSFIRPITFNIQTVVNKRSSAWIKAMEEMRAHQALLLEAACSDDDETLEIRSNVSKIVKPTATVVEAPPCKNVTVNINRLSCSLNDKPIDSLNASAFLSNNKVDTEVSLEIATLKNEIQELKRNHAAEIKMLQETHERKKMTEIEALKQAHAVEVQTLKDEYENQIALNKKKQWCSQCGKEGLYHCCINVQYCSTDCQQIHWRVVHKKVCRRERETKSEKEKK